MKTKLVKICFILSVVLNLCFILLCVGVIIHEGGIPWLISKISNERSTIEHDTYYYSKTTLFDVLPKKENQIVFIGDSIMDGCEWSELLSNTNIVNRGINKDTTQGILDRIDEIINLQPKQIFVMIGINDLDQGVSQETIINNYKEIIDKIQENSKDTKIVIQSILPINNELSGSNVKNDQIGKINSDIKELALSLNCTFIDLYSYFVKDNQLNKDYTIDGIHLNGQGYLIWKGQISNLVNSQ